PAPQAPRGTQPQRGTVQLERRTGPALLGVAGEGSPVLRLRQPGGTGGGEPEPGGAGLPRQRHPAAVPPLLLTLGAEERGILTQLVRQRRVLRQAELLTLEQVG